ncbi:MAG: peptide deformylase [Chitinophagaceae bacterium]
MILPIVAYGHPVLRKVADDISLEYPDLEKVLADMWDTMYHSNGVGLAAPQVNRPIRLFVIDSQQIFENMKEDDDKQEYPDMPGLKQAFLNPHVVSVEGEEWSYNEGCLSIPKIREDVFRSEGVTIDYLDEQFVAHRKTFNGITARILLHEYDHLEGKLFIDYLKPLKRKLLRRKLDDISKGKIKTDYRMVFPK